MINEKICEKIRLERLKRKYTQEEFADITGLSRNMIWKIETKRVSPTVKTLEKIAHALGMDFATLTDVSKVDL